MLDFLGRIEQRPEMYLGGSPAERREQLRNLTWVLIGYESALKQHCPDSEGNFLIDLSLFIAKRHHSSGAEGPVVAVTSIAKTPEEAWSLFWDCVHAFREIDGTGEG